MSPTGDLLVTFIFLWGRCPLELAQRPPCVALALHLVRRSTPFGVTTARGVLLRCMRSHYALEINGRMTSIGAMMKHIPLTFRSDATKANIQIKHQPRLE